MRARGVFKGCLARYAGKCPGAASHVLDHAVKVPWETNEMRGRGFSRLDTTADKGWRLWPNAQGAVKEVLGLRGSATEVQFGSKEVIEKVSSASKLIQKCSQK